MVDVHGSEAKLLVHVHKALLSSSGLVFITQSMWSLVHPFNFLIVSFQYNVLLDIVSTLLTADTSWIQVKCAQKTRIKTL